MKTSGLDVAIVGFGPVGATAASLLARRGFSVAAFERETDVYHLPRAAHFDAEIMRVFQEIGAAESILPCTAHGFGMHFLAADGAKLFGVDASDEPCEQGWAQHYMFYQPDLELALRARAAELGVETHPGHEVEAIAQDEEGADVLVRSVATRHPRQVRARWVLGCDGAASFVRRTIGASLEDLAFDQPWLVVDAVLRRPVDLPRLAIQYCDPKRPTTFVPMAGRRRRWEFMLLPGESREGMERRERVAELLAPWVSTDDVEVIRAVVYTFHALIVSPWRRGRMFLLGDAAHQMPPFLGQGMCSGIRDAANLAWKLDLVRRGAAGDGLLETYEAERSPHVRTIIETAVRAGRVIQTTDPAVAEARDAELRSSNAPDVLRHEMPPLGSGVLDRDPASEAMGRLVPQPRDASGRLLDEVLGDGFAVVAPGDPRAHLSPASSALWERLGARLVAAPSLAPWLARHAAQAVVVRPDRYVFGLARAPGDLDRLAGELRARLS